jgi:hypothetical protein
VFDLFLEPTTSGFAISDDPAKTPAGQTKLQFACAACGTRWTRIKDFEAACAAAGFPVAPIF